MLYVSKASSVNPTVQTVDKAGKDLDLGFQLCGNVASVCVKGYKHIGGLKPRIIDVKFS